MTLAGAPACHIPDTPPQRCSPIPTKTSARDDTGRRRYTTSKLCNVLFTYELDRRLGSNDQNLWMSLGEGA